MVFSEISSCFVNIVESNVVDWVYPAQLVFKDARKQACLLEINFAWIIRVHQASVTVVAIETSSKLLCVLCFCIQVVIVCLMLRNRASS